MCTKSRDKSRDELFKNCCALHNFLTKVDGIDIGKEVKVESAILQRMSLEALFHTR